VSLAVEPVSLVLVTVGFLADAVTVGFELPATHIDHLTSVLATVSQLYIRDLSNAL
jgi:hypothetical protein